MVARAAYAHARVRRGGAPGGWDMGLDGLAGGEGRSQRADERAGAEGIDTVVLHSPLDAAGAAQSGAWLALRHCPCGAGPDLAARRGSTLGRSRDSPPVWSILRCSAAPGWARGRRALCLLCGATPGLEEAEEGAFCSMRWGGSVLRPGPSSSAPWNTCEAKERMRLHAAALGEHA